PGGRLDSGVPARPHPARKLGLLVGPPAVRAWGGRACSPVLAWEGGPAGGLQVAGAASRRISREGGVVMPNRAALILVLCCAVAGGGATRVSAQSCGPDPACASNVPRSMFYAGVGAGFGLLASGEQSVVQQA